MEKLGYVPVVKSAVVDQDEWRDMKRADVDPEWGDEVSADEDLPLPDEGELPLPERASSPEDLPLPDLGMSLADGDLPLPDLGMSVADGDLPLPRFETVADEDGRPGLVPPFALPANDDGARHLSRTLAEQPEAGPALEPAFESQPVRIGAHDGARLSHPAGGTAFSEPPRTGRMSAPAPAAPSRRPLAADNDASLVLPPMSMAPARPSLSPSLSAPEAEAGAAQAFAPASTLSDAPSLASLRAAASPVATDAAAQPRVPGGSLDAGAASELLRGPFSAPPDLTSSEAAQRLQALVAPVSVVQAGASSAPPDADAAWIGTEAPLPMSTRPAGPESSPSSPSSPAPESMLSRSGPVPTHASLRASSAPAVPRAPVRPPPPPGGRASSVPTDEERLSHARALAEAGRLEDALTLLEPLCVQQPEHEGARVLLLDLCCKLPRASKALAHAEWLTVSWLQTARVSEACGVYRLVRATFPELPLSERMLVASVEAADRAGDSQVVVDAAKLLVHGYPESAYVPRVLTKAADQQVASGRPDLARATLEYLATRYPSDPLGQAARQRLGR